MFSIFFSSLPPPLSSTFVKTAMHNNAARAVDGAVAVLITAVQVACPQAEGTRTVLGIRTGIFVDWLGKNITNATATVFAARAHRAPMKQGHRQKRPIEAAARLKTALLVIK